MDKSLTDVPFKLKCNILSSNNVLSNWETVRLIWIIKGGNGLKSCMFFLKVKTSQNVLIKILDTGFISVISIRYGIGGFKSWSVGAVLKRSFS